MPTERRTPTAEHFVGGLLGLAIGDALGRPTEGQRHDEIRALGRASLLTFRPYHDGRLGRDLPPGSWSDDTQQALLLADSLVAHGGLDARDFAERLYALWRSGEARGYGRVYRQAMEGRDAGRAWDEVAVDGDLMNGAAMRIAPLGLFYWFDAERLTAAAVRSAQVTHRHPAAIAGAAGVAHAFAYVLANGALSPARLIASVQERIAPLDGQTAAYLDTLGGAVVLPPDDAFVVLNEVPEFASPPAPGRGSGVGGMTISLLLCSLYLFLHFEGDFRRAVESALLLGGDTDGTAATAGALCAAWRGAGALPQSLAARVEDGERIRDLAHRLYERSLAVA